MKKVIKAKSSKAKVAAKGSAKSGKARKAKAERATVEYSAMYLAGELADDQRIRLAPDYAKPASNPKRGASAKRFALYYTKRPRTVAAAVAAGLSRADVRWDLQHGFIVKG